MALTRLVTNLLNKEEESIYVSHVQKLLSKETIASQNNELIVLHYNLFLAILTFTPYFELSFNESCLLTTCYMRRERSCRSQDNVRIQLAAVISC